MAAIDSLVDALVNARVKHEPCDQQAFDGILVTQHDSYAVQKQVAQRMGWLEQGFPRYWKSGGPSREAILTHALLPESGVWISPARPDPSCFFSAEIEAEIAVRLAQDVTPEIARKLNAADGPQLVDAIAVSIEIVDSRWRQGRTVPSLFSLADMQSHGALVLGSWVQHDQHRPQRAWDTQLCSVAIGDHDPLVFKGTHPLKDPFWGLATWLGHATSAFGTAPAGTVITTGSWCGVLPLRFGQRVKVEFEGIGQAEIQV